VTSFGISAPRFAALRRSVAGVGLRVYRVGVLVAIAWIVREHHVRMRIEGNEPITVGEVTSLFPAATQLHPDKSERAGMFVIGAHNEEIGYVLRTAPITDSIIGYRGPTDTLIGFDRALHVVGVRIRSSHDTREHVQDVRDDRTFLKTWNGQSWSEVARVTPEQAGIEGVSGATMTSMAVAEAIMHRLQAADAAVVTPPLSWRIAARDVGLAICVAIGLVLAFTGTHGRAWIRRAFQVVVIGYIGLLNGDLLAQSLLSGWMQHGVPWRTAPGLVLMLAASLVIPWSSGRALYCQHLCPHGAAQELLHAIAPRRWRLALPRGIDAGLRWLPPLLLAVVLLATILTLPLDLAGLEPFDAYIVRTAGIATLAIAVTSLVASLFVPMAYCHYGCPTGALLNFVRAHGRIDRFGRREISAAALVLLALLLSSNYHAIHGWMVGPDARQPPNVAVESN
jgi:hypothetical protein